MTSNSKTNNLIDKFISFLIEKTLSRKINESNNKRDSNQFIFSDEMLDSSLDSKNFKNLQNLIKIFCLICFLPYGIIGMFFVNKSMLFIPCLILGTFTVLLSMFFSIRLQAIQEGVKFKIKNYSENLDKFISENKDNIEYLKGLEILEQSLKNNNKPNISIDSNFIANSFSSARNTNQTSSEEINSSSHNFQVNMAIEKNKNDLENSKTL
jgi:hypothetical protein